MNNGFARDISWFSFAATIAMCYWLVACSETPSKSTSTSATEKDSEKSSVTVEEIVSYEPLSVRAAQSGPGFTTLPSDRTGVKFLNEFDWDNPRKQLYQHGYAGGGVCVGDYDDDGLPDLYLVSQIHEDRLYRNLGDMRFEDVTESSGVYHAPTWGTGATFADVDNDGDLDLFVCNLDSPNRLYINNGRSTFDERASEFGLDFSGASVMGAFADYDLDGFLDLYLLTNRQYPGPADDVYQPFYDADGNAAVAPDQRELFAVQQRAIDGEIQKFIVKAGQADRLYRNEGGAAFTDVTESAGVSGRHPGLSVTWWDFNADNRPDLYIGNDFWDPDQLYRNNGDGTFTDVARETLPHTTWFSMGADQADINNDGLLDLLSTDMAPTTHYMSKIMMGDMNESRWFLESAEPRQYMRNALYLNTGTPRFMETAFLCGLASTDWTWSVKCGDLDNDGWIDVFVTNGTANHSFDPDLTRDLQRLQQEMMRQGISDPQQLWNAQWTRYRQKQPQKERNLAFRNEGDLHFHDASDEWSLDPSPTVSFGAVVCDLDRDGDLDIVSSNVGDPVLICRNDLKAGHGAILRLKGTASNSFGLGARVTIESDHGSQTRYLAPVSGYMSSNEPVLHIGLGDDSMMNRVVIHWPSGMVQVLERVPSDHVVTVSEPRDTDTNLRGTISSEAPQTVTYENISSAMRLSRFGGQEVPFDDYAREPLLPARMSQMGPGAAWGDVDGDGDDDLYLGGSADQSGRLLLQTPDGAFSEPVFGPWVDDQRAEDMGALFFDADGDDDLDLYVASGSTEWPAGHRNYRDRLYLNDGAGRFHRAAGERLPEHYENSSCVCAADFDRDGDLDLFVGSRSVPGQYPLTPTSHLLRNERGQFIDDAYSAAQTLPSVGLVTSGLWTDVDRDGWIDLMVATEWGPVHCFRNVNGQLQNVTDSSGVGSLFGWWNSIAAADVDGDGDVDYAVGNAGLNTKYKASADQPATIYYGDMDDSGRMSIVEAKMSDMTQLPVRGLSCSSEAMPSIRAQLATYDAFASATLQDIYSQDRLDRARRVSATELRSGVLINESDPIEGIRFTFMPFERYAQASPIYGTVMTDMNGDGHCDVYAVQNFFSREPETGRWDGGIGVLLCGDGKGAFHVKPPSRTGLIVSGDAKSLTLCDWNSDGRPDLFVTRNGDSPLLFSSTGKPPPESRPFSVQLKGPPGNTQAIGARVRILQDSIAEGTYEITAGSGYLSQSTPGIFGSREVGRVITVEITWPDNTHSTHVIPPDVTRFVVQYASPS